MVAPIPKVIFVAFPQANKLTASLGASLFSVLYETLFFVKQRNFRVCIAMAPPYQARLLT